MSRSRKDIVDTEHMLQRLQALGFTRSEAEALRRISMTLHRWHEMECGLENGCVERDEKTNKTYWLNSYTGKRWPIADRETGAIKRLTKIINARNDRQLMNGQPIDVDNPPLVTSYIQGDPRGAALYILRPGDVPQGERAESYYTRGIAVYQ
jgi:hypothetical protein